MIPRYSSLLRTYPHSLYIPQYIDICLASSDIQQILEKMNYHLEHCRRTLLTHLERRRQLFPRFYFLSMEDVMHVVCNGYDLKQVNLYVNKLFSNVGMLVYKEVEDGEKMVFQINAVKSALGEKLTFKEVCVNV